MILADLAVQFLGSSILLQVEATLIRITTEVHGVATHHEDDLVIATAELAQANYLVTGDRKLRELGPFRRITFLSPREFLDLLQIATHAGGTS